MHCIIKGFTAGFVLCALAASAQSVRSVEDILADYVKAAGGLAAIDAINSRKIHATTGLFEKQELYWQKPNKVLLLADKEKTGYDGASGWVYSKRKKLRRLSQGQQIPLEMDANPLRYVHLRQLYAEISASPQRTIDGTLMEILISPNDLAQTTFYFDAHTHLLARLDEKGETSAYFTHMVWFEDYRAIDGILFPYLITHKSSGKGGDPSTEFHVKKIEHNIQLEANIFSKPQSTKLVLGGKR